MLGQQERISLAHRFFTGTWWGGCLFFLHRDWRGWRMQILVSLILCGLMSCTLWSLFQIQVKDVPTRGWILTCSIVSKGTLRAPADANAAETGGPLRENCSWGVCSAFHGWSCWLRLEQSLWEWLFLWPTLERFIRVFLPLFACERGNVTGPITVTHNWTSCFLMLCTKSTPNLFIPLRLWLGRVFLFSNNASLKANASGHL